jgi:hypothetical protein
VASTDPIGDVLRALATLHGELAPLAESAHVRMPGLFGGPDAFLALLVQLPEPEHGTALAAFRRADGELRPLVATLKRPKSGAGP